ncbi:MAG TPA: hypothetical protein VLA35_10380, partial [Thermoleophilia bacterium]|nr:hypothetical protein [Thermoleophilia bacterium]
MKTLRLVALLVAAAMFLVACGTGNGNGDDDPVVTTGTLFVNVNVPATVTVLDSDGVQIDKVLNTQAKNWTVEAGNYTVQAEAVGYGAQSEPVTITAGQSSTVNFSLLADTVVLGNVASVEIVGFVDENGDPYDWDMEENPVKDATLVAAQTEEMVGVVVRALDADGDPVAGAPVTIGITGDFSDALAIYPGKASDVMPSAAQTFQGLTTDADGYAYFVIEATNAFPTWQEILNGFGFFYGPRYPLADLQASQVIGDGFGLEPVKLIVSSVGGDMIAKRSEFKAWFVNMSHLWYGEPDADDNLDEDSLVYTDLRLGADLGEIFNIWLVGSNDYNGHDFGTFAITKQPTSDPFAVGYDMFGFFEYGGNGNGFKPSGMAMPWFGAPGYMVYTMSGDTDLVAWDNCDYVSADGLTCEDYGSGVSLVPLPSVDLEDLPISVTVDATYVFEVP